MDVISYTAVRAKLAEAMDRVNDDHRPVIITRQRGKPAVLISLDDFNSYVETEYLLSSPKNAARISKAIRDLKTRRGRVHKLIR
jgi:antitoxin YefM